MDKHHHSLATLQRELRMIVRRGRHVWRLVPHRHRFALGGATLLIGVTSLTNTAIPLLLGRLFDGLRVDLARGLGAQAVYRGAIGILGLIGGVYLVREAVNVARRYLVENTCTRIDRDMTV